ncbi:MAG: GGDEF domain-containing protein [Nitrosomonadales bacterium]|nr:GGDEF domain-containing protein [Nitrosomonadales bacterium]
MKYPHETAASGEILRLILQKMVLHPAAFTPPNYAVWYEYLAGINPALIRAMGPLLEGDARLDDDTVEKLYSQYVSECSSDIQKFLRGGIRQLLGKLVESTAEATREAVHFGSRLQTHGDALKGDIDSAKLRSLIENLAGDTGKMQGSMQTLEAQLEASKQEVETLNKEIESARAEALTDPLTQVLNRRGLEAAAQPIFDDPASSGNGFCLLMLDIDHFKKVNDTYGHLFGDKVICAIANTLKSKVKGQDAVARIGGEEFVVLLPDTNINGAFIVAEHIRQAIESGKIRRLDSSEHIGGISISVGIASHTTGATLLELLDRADKALYAAKQGGRNRTSVFTLH